jgi:hypothetical protein
LGDFVGTPSEFGFAFGANSASTASRFAAMRMWLSQIAKLAAALVVFAFAVFMHGSIFVFLRRGLVFASLQCCAKKQTMVSRTDSVSDSDLKKAIPQASTYNMKATLAAYTILSRRGI